MLTGHQLHAARILAGLSVADLSARAGLTPAELEGLESRAGASLPVDKPVTALRSVLEAAGIAFLSEGGRGVLLRPTGRSVDEGLRPEALNAENDD